MAGWGLGEAAKGTVRAEGTGCMAGREGRKRVCVAEGGVKHHVAEQWGAGLHLSRAYCAPTLHTHTQSTRQDARRALVH